MKFNFKPPCLIFYKDDLGLEDGNTIYGKAKGFVVWIRTDMKGHQEILEHEFEHIRQFWMLGWFHMIFLWIPSYRRWVEKKAYEVQNKCR